MSRPLIMPALATLTFALVGCATAGSTGDHGGAGESAAAGQSSVPETPDPMAMQLVAQATELALAGQCARAIPEALEPALAIFERQYGAGQNVMRASRLINGGGVSAIGNAPESSGRVGAEWSDAMYLHAFCLVDAGRGAEAAVLLSRALTLIPNDVVYACELGHVRQQEGRFDEAMGLYGSAFENAQMLQRSGVTDAVLFGQRLEWWARRSLRGIGYSLVELNRLEDAERVYREVLAIDPNDEQAVRELQLIATRRGAI